MSVNVRVLGTPLILALESDALPENNHRIGSIPIVFKNGARTKIRVFGSAPYKPSTDFVRAFEAEIRALVEDAVIYSQLYGDVDGPISAVRFNPALIQRQRGW